MDGPQEEAHSQKMILEAELRKKPLRTTLRRAHSRARRKPVNVFCNLVPRCTGEVVEESKMAGLVDNHY